MERGPKERVHEKNRPKRHEGNPEKDVDRAVEYIKERTFEVLEKGPQPSIRLEFFRHDDKAEKPKDGDDNKVRLTPAPRGKTPN